MDHLDHIRRRERSDRQWTLSSLWSVLGGTPFRRKLSNSVKQIDVRSWRAAPSVYEGHDDGTRVLLIGAALNAQVERDGKLVILSAAAREERVAAWLDAHPYEAEWLASNGITPAAARKAHEDWIAASDADLATAKSVGLTPR